MGTHTVAVDTVNGTLKDEGLVDAIMAQADQILGALRIRSDNGKNPALLPREVGKWRALSARPMFIGPVQGMSTVPPGSTTSVPSPLSDHYGFFTLVELKAGS